MPLYEFHCPECERVTEENFKIAERPDCVTCTFCGNKNAEYRVSLGNYHKLNDPELRKKVLMQRSADQTAKELKHNYDKFGFKAFGGQKFTGFGEGKIAPSKKKKQKKS